MSTARTLPAAETSRPMLYLALTKPDVSFLVVMTTLAGFYLGSRGALDWLLMAHTVFATTLVAAGTSALNHFIERDTDAHMRRTAMRPLPSGQLSAREAQTFGLILVVIGVAYLALTAGIEASLLGVFTSASYLAVYTPLKKRTALATAVGAIPGAMPPLIGWVAAGRTLNLEAFVLFAVLFLWQFPHFMAISWMYREDYARAGLHMIPPGDQSRGSATFLIILLTGLALLPISLLTSILGLTGPLYYFGAVVVGFLLIQVCLWAGRTKSNVRAKWLMHATVLHLPLLLGLMMYDKLPH
jgi:protoheme IX farnesyltransferase